METNDMNALRNEQWRVDLRNSKTPKERTAITRVEMPQLDPAYRITCNEEVNQGISEEQAVLEASRCLDCANPQCVTGCPVSINIPKFIKNIERGNFAEAAATLKETSSLPAVCGRVCPQEKQCESKCIHLKMKHPAVAIGYLERFAADWQRNHDDGALPAMAPANGIKVAVIGSGPSGLSFAGDMAKRGYDVTVFEAHGLEPTFSCFIFSVLTSGFYLYAKALEGGFCNPEQYETVLVLEEANKVLTGNDTAGSASKGIGQASLAGESIFEEILDQAAGYGLFVIAITQKISMMPSSVIANCGLLFVGRLASPQDVDLAIRMIGREGRYEDRDIVKWLPASPIGWFICRSNRIMDYCDADPVLVQIRPLEKPALTNKVLEEYIAKGEDIRKRNEQLK